jgi:hypothetical protein
MTCKCQGSVEVRNRDGALGMSDLVTIQRAYAANVDALKVMEGVLATVTSEVGQLANAQAAGSWLTPKRRAADSRDQLTGQRRGCPERYSTALAQD